MVCLCSCGLTFESLQLSAQKQEANYNDLVMEHQRLQDKYSLEADMAQDKLLKLQTSCQESERQLNSGSSHGCGSAIVAIAAGQWVGHNCSRVGGAVGGA